jgi:hypothetical protein
MDAVQAFGHAESALWFAPAGDPDRARALLPPVHTALLDACKALAEGGRLEAWERTDHEGTWAAFHVRNQRVMSRSSYDWACRLFSMAREGQLSEALLTETWETEGLRDAFHWLRVFVYGLAGEGARLPCTVQGPPVPPHPDRKRQVLKSLLRLYRAGSGCTACKDVCPVNLLGC